jgi:hypothetical protein
MATKKKTKKKHAKSRKMTGKKVKRSKKAVKAKMAKKTSPKKKAAGKTKRAVKKRVRGKSQTVDTVSFVPKGLGARSGGQSGDLQGLSNLAGANSESVDELLEEGNAFEAEVVKGVQDADDADEGEVHTHEVPADDVPGEYRKKEE